jgi:large subunit ribosomal protein LP2
MDHLSPLISETFHDSAIAKGFSCKRTKAAAITYNVLAESFKSTLRNDVNATGNENSQKFVSLIIDETTDKGTKKCMAIVIKYFCERLLKVNTRLLNLVPVDGETAAEFFKRWKTIFVNTISK